MKNRAEKFLVILAFLVLVVPFFFIQSQAQENDEILRSNSFESSCNPTIYEVEIELNRISSVNPQENTYKAEFWLTVVIPDENDPTDFLKNLPNFDFVNSNEEQPRMGKKVIEPHFFEALVSGTFFNPFNFKHFPYEKYEMPIGIELLDKNSCEVIFELSPESTDFKAVIGYPNYKTQFDTIFFSYSSDEDDNWSRIVIDTVANANPEERFMKFIFPIILLTSLAIMIFWLPGEFMTKIELNALFLVSAVFFTQLIQLESSYITDFTLYDTVILFSYGVFLFTIVSPAIQMKVSKINETDMRIRKVEKISKYLMIVLIAISIITVINL